jgi:hypothetical protein
MLQAGRSPVRYRVTRNNFFFQFTKSFWPHDALGFTQPITEISTKNRKIMFLGNKLRQVRRADSLAAIYEPIV